MISESTRIAANHFGLGIRPDISDLAKKDPKKWLKWQLKQPIQPVNVGDTKALSMLLTARSEKNQMSMKAAREEARQEAKKTIYWRFQAGVSSPNSLIERLVYFWNNHFTVAPKNAQLAALIPAYENQAIRPHVTSKFEDLLLSVTQHPAMLIYLENIASIGPNSRFGKRRSKTYNENLAREILELHTLGVEGGYNQQDVIALAKLITGWSVNKNSGSFEFRPVAHEQGTITLLGKDYPDLKSGTRRQDRGIEALRDLARHPSTARFICTKLARHFISDIPPERAINALEQTYLRTDGDLSAVYETLIDCPEAWEHENSRKFKSSTELIISALRLSGQTTIKPDFLRNSLRELGYAPFTADSPEGFPDTAQELLGPDALLRRINWGQYASTKLPFELAPDSAAHFALGDRLNPATYKLISQAKNRDAAYAVLLASPEFQWR